ncbi:MAG: hypothetical protein K0S26_1103 [Bacteroidota bacterium]|nr:hypothetical protein [Bacteroidota bacterium]
MKSKSTPVKKTSCLFYGFLLSFLISSLFNSKTMAQGGIPVKDGIFSQNAWLIDMNMSSSQNTNFIALLPTVAASGVKYVRIGGIGPNFFPLYVISGTTITDASKLTTLIDAIRSNGMEPIIEVSYVPITCASSPLNAKPLSDQATIAANLVDYINNTYLAPDPKGPIINWIIANEPDAMKNKDDRIKIIGPELASFGNDKTPIAGSSPQQYYNPSQKIMNDLVSDPATNTRSIMGSFTTAFSSTRYYVDVISFHYYPQNYLGTAYPAFTINNPSDLTNGFKGNIIDNGSASDNLNGLIEMISNVPGRDISNVKLACTEYNIEEVVGDESTNYEGVMQGYDMRSFLSGQWLADVLSIAMGTSAFNSVTGNNESWIDNMCFWSIKEGGCDATGFPRGYLSSCSSHDNRKRPGYHVFKMMADNFKGGNYYPSTRLTGDNNLKIFTGIDITGKFVVAIINQNQETNTASPTTKSLLVSLTNTSPVTSGTFNYKYKTNSATGFNFEKTYSIPNESTYFYVYNTDGTLYKECHYRLYGEALSIAATPVYNGETLDQPVCNSIELNVTGTSSPCSSIDGQADVTVVSGGTGPFAYSWSPVTGSNPSSASTPNYSGLPPGYYTVKVTDANGLTSYASVLVPEGVAAEDLYVKDSNDDIGQETNNVTTTPLWESPDIWVRQINDGMINQTSQEVTYNGSIPLHVYVRVTNKGCATSSGTANLKTYWASSGTGLAWDAAWVANTSGVPCSAPLSGDLIGTQTIPVLTPGQSTIMHYLYYPEPPLNFSCLGTEFKHVCLLARIETSTTPPYGMNTAYPEGTGIWVNTKNQNNIAWRNITVKDTWQGMVPFGGVLVQNIVKETPFINLTFNSIKDDNGQTLLDYNKLRLKLDKELMRRWREGGMRGRKVIMVNDTTVEVTDTLATMENIFLRVGEYGGISLIMDPFKIPVPSKDTHFGFSITQTDQYVGKTGPQGGQSYRIAKIGTPVKPCLTSIYTLSGLVVGIQPFKKDTLFITGNINIPLGSVLKLQNMVVLIAENVKIKVLAGGSLVLENAELRSACIGKRWAGIEVKGNPLSTKQLIISNSFISGSDNPIIIEKTKGFSIISTSIMGDGLGTAITMDKMKDFEIYGNTFSNFETGIKTSNTYAADAKSIIEKNIFVNVKNALQFFKDNHSKLEIKCNRFDYADYAIESDQTILADQGFIGEGAGNEFNTTSTLSNNKLKHTNGNNAKYYYDPSKPIVTGMNITTLSSTLDRTCYAYTFDTTSTPGSGARMANQAIESGMEGILRDKMDVYAVPNPNSGFAAIYFSLGEGTQGDLLVMDMYGKVVDLIKINSSSNKVEVDYSQYANGVYLLSLTNTNGESVNKKMIIAK